MSLGYTIQGFNLHQPDLGFQLMEGSSHSSSIAPRRVNLLVPGMHGEIPAWNDPLGTTEISLRVRIKDPNPASLEQKWVYLRSLCMAGQNNPVVLRRETEDHNAFAHVQLLSMSEPDFYCAAGIVDTVIIFHNPSGRLQDARTPEDQPLSLPGAQQVVLAAAESSAPITEAYFRLKGPVSSINIRNPYNDTGFNWFAPTSLTANQWAIIDTKNYQVWVNTTDDWDARQTDVSRTLYTEGNGMLSMTPLVTLDIGNNSNITAVSGSGIGDGAELVVRARRTYL